MISRNESLNRGVPLADPPTSGKPIEAERELFRNRVITTGPRYLGICQPHSPAGFKIEEWEVLSLSFASIVEQFITQDLRVLFLFEEAGKRETRRKKKVRRWLTGEEAATVDFKALKESLDWEKHPQRAYNLALLNIFHDIRQIFGADKVWGVLERSIGLRKPSDQFYDDLEGEDTPLKRRLSCFTQLCAYAATRDLRVAGQALDEISKDPKQGIIAFRGSAHLGINTALKVLAERAGLAEDEPFVDIYTPQTALFRYVIWPGALILWSERFWREIIEEHNLNLDTLRRNPILQRVYSGIRRKLHQEPWASHLRERVIEGAKDPEGHWPIELVQGVFKS